MELYDRSLSAGNEPRGVPRFFTVTDRPVPGCQERVMFSERAVAELFRSVDAATES